MNLNLENMQTVFLKDVFSKDWVIDSVVEISSGILKVEAKRKILLDDQFNRFSETCTKMYANNICKRINGYNINQLIKPL